LFKHVPDGKIFFDFIRGQSRVSSESLVRLILTYLKVIEN